METLAGRYELGDALGQGRSTVYRAVDSRLRRDVAIKRVQLLAGQEDADQVRIRALREAQASARLNNPAVVTVYDVVEEDGAIWLVMELVAGPSLSQIVTDEGPLPARRAAAIGLGVLTALEAAHLVGVVHRDVKPANVLVTEGDRAKLTDFGVATIRDESRVTATGLIVGSPSYMAPEQATGGEITASTDLWALGALLYFAVEGQPPFLAGNALATASAVVHGEPRPQQNPGPLSPVISRLLVKDPGQRARAGEIRAALTRIARGDRRRRRTATAPAAATRVMPATPPAPAPPPVVAPSPEPSPPPGPAPSPEPMTTAEHAPAPEPMTTAEHAPAPEPMTAADHAPAPEPAPPPTVSAEPASAPEPTAEPTPSAEPSSERAADDTPSAEPSPEAAPVPEPAPSADTTSEPTPSAEPSPAPAPTQDPAPTPEPTSAVAPTTASQPDAEPTAASEEHPAPVPTPEPTLVSDPSPDPTPTPEPAPEPQPAPVPEPTPEPTPPTPDPVPVGHSAPASEPGTTQGPERTTPPATDTAPGDRPSEARRRLVLVAVGAVALLLAAIAIPALRGDDDQAGNGNTATTQADSDPAPPDDATTRPETTAPETTGSTEPSTTSTAAPGALPADWAPFADPQGAYTIGLPPGWQVQPTDYPQRIDLVEPSTGRMLRIEWVEPPNGDPVGAWQSSVAGFRANNTGYEEIGIGPASYRDYDAALWEFRHDGSGQQLHTGNLGFVTNGRGYALMLRTPEDQWAASQPLFEQFKQAFQPT